MNVRLLRRVVKHILAEPKRHDMSVWVQTPLHSFLPDTYKFPSCGTVCCIFGWAKALATKRIGDDLRSDVVAMQPFCELDGADLLGVTGYQAHTLFHVGNWPERFRVRSRKSIPGTKAHAQATADLIEYFIQQKGNI